VEDEAVAVVHHLDHLHPHQLAHPSNNNSVA
jgi:hypothetical protein